MKSLSELAWQAQALRKRIPGINLRVSWTCRCCHTRLVSARNNRISLKGYECPVCEMVETNGAFHLLIWEREELRPPRPVLAHASTNER